MRLAVALALCFVLTGCGYKGNVDNKARAWADDCGCDKVSNFKNNKYVAGTATSNNGEMFDKPTDAAYAEYSFDCYYSGVGNKKWTFGVFLLKNPVTGHDFGFMGDESIAKARAEAAGFRPS